MSFLRRFCCGADAANPPQEDYSVSVSVMGNPKVTTHCDSAEILNRIFPVDASSRELTGAQLRSSEMKLEEKVIKIKEKPEVPPAVILANQPAVNLANQPAVVTLRIVDKKREAYANDADRTFVIVEDKKAYDVFAKANTDPRQEIIHFQGAWQRDELLAECLKAFLAPAPAARPK